MDYDPQANVSERREIKVSSKTGSFSKGQIGSCRKTKIPKTEKWLNLKIGNYTIVSLSHQDKQSRWHFVCRCECGSYSIKARNALDKNSKHCLNCISYESVTTHGMKNSREYKVWQGIKQRCLNPNNKDYPRYGARGIIICQEWLLFDAFYKDMGPMPIGDYSIDRINNDLGYSQSNCRWATRSENQSNQKDSNWWVVRGIKFTNSAQAAAHFGISDTHVCRLVYGFFDKRRNRFTPPKQNCYLIPKYENN